MYGAIVYRLRDRGASLDVFKLYFWAIMIVIVAELCGPIKIPVGSGNIVLLPYLWATLLALAVGLMGTRLNRLVAIDIAAQCKAALIFQTAILVFIAKLGLLVGESVPVIINAGWAIIFQELGHFVGTILLGLPVALLLGIKREAVGATFSVGREPSLAIISEKYGMNSPEGRGVMGEYLTNTLLGTLFMTFAAGLVTSLGVFDPKSLAMGAGIGSGTMMAAAAGAIAAQQTPEVAKEVMAIAAAANLMTTTIGTYFTLFISLPLANWAYRTFEPIIGRVSSASIPSDGDFSLSEGERSLTWSGKFFAWTGITMLALLANYVAFASIPAILYLGLALLIAIAFVGEFLFIITRRKIPVVCWVSIVAMFLTSPANPFAEEVKLVASSVNIITLITPILAFVGLSIAKDLRALKQLGWRLVLVSLLATFGTFIGATLVAELFH
ncbi:MULTISPECIES: DUF3100 domain-containing protein [Pseudomonas]|uniref:DUF3100 domain-containing protein n=1 Tax=Pseudomonas TaxID=286 RepID=UPI0002E17BC8|nr:MULTISPECIES: DUF3100 domain-containing protein [Pseudomonas]